MFNAISVDHDQKPHSTASDLGLHCLLVFLLSDTGHKSDNVYGKVPELQIRRSTEDNSKIIFLISQ